MMLRKMMIALAATALVGAMAASDPAQARMGGFGGGGFHGGGFHGGGFGGMHAGFGGMRGGFAGARAGFVGARPGFVGARAGFVGARPGFVGTRFAGRPFVGRGFVGRPFVGRPFARRAFFFRHHRRFFAGPFFVGAGLGLAAASWPYYDSYYDNCWVVRYTPWGPRTVNVCGYGDYYGYY